MHRVSSCDERATYVLCLQLLLTVWPGRVTINTLPEDVLLHIIHFDRMSCVGTALRDTDAMRGFWRWDRLVHVCQRWRSVVFASPNFLDLELYCHPLTRVELTSIWPPLPIIITNVHHLIMPEDYDFGAAIVHPNRVREIRLNITSSQLPRLASAVQEQFPALTKFSLVLVNGHIHPTPVPVLPDGFLGAFAPLLRNFTLQFIPFPALPKLLLSATDLVSLSLVSIPHSGYFSPEAIVTSLAVMANLDFLNISFTSPLSFPKRERRHPPPPTRTILPVLTHLRFQGVSEYLEDFMAQIDTPLLRLIWVYFFHQLIFDTPRLAQFMRRTARFQALDEACVVLDFSGVRLGYYPSIQANGLMSSLKIACKELDWGLSCVAQVITSFFPSIHTAEHLYIYEFAYPASLWRDDIETMRWLEIFRPFTAAKNLYMSQVVASSIAPTLEELVGGRTTEVLPGLQTIFLEGLKPSEPVQEGIGKFVAARELFGRPITVSLWENVRKH